MKPYPSKKDHFYDVFGQTDLHKRMGKIFAEIDAAGVLEDKIVEDITLRYGGEHYQKGF